MSGIHDGREGDEEEYETAYETLQDGDDGGEELAFDDEEESLPWLESGEYEDEDEGYDTGKLVGIALLGLIGIAALLGLFWWLGNRGADPELVADGSTIEAPDGPVKERPEDPGGKEFAGTGDVAPSVGEGQTREGTVDDAPRPSIDAAGSKAGSSGSSASASGAASSGSGQAASSGGVGVQVGAYSSRASAQTGWTQITRQTDALQGVKYRIVEGQADIGTVFRLQAVAGDAAAANRLCNALKADGVQCQVKR